MIKKMFFNGFAAATMFFVAPVDLQAENKLNIVETASNAGQFKTLLAAATAAGLAEVLQSPGPFTILAPTDEAFAKLPKGTISELLKAENKAKLVAILKYHVISGSVSAREVAGLKSAKNILGEDLSISFVKGRLNVSGANVIDSDIFAKNGVIHVIDKVLLPPTPVTQQVKMQKLIELSIEKGVALFNKGEHAGCAAVYLVCASSLLNLSGDTLSKAALNDLKKTIAASQASDTPARNAWALRGVLDRTYTALQTPLPREVKAITAPQKINKVANGFKVKLEAKLPEGFPAPGPLGEIVLKDYPVYRAARVEGASMQNIAFMRLFGHIKSNDISMTAPVEMKLDTDNSRRKSMAFLYGKPQLGSAGRTKSGVDVVDLPAQKYLSLGLNGRESKTRIKGAVDQLQQWLKQNEKYKLAGEARLLGYNSPMVSSAKRFWEVQIPVNLIK